MPRSRNTDKFLRVNQRGQKIPKWKQKILDRKAKKKWKKADPKALEVYKNQINEDKKMPNPPLASSIVTIPKKTALLKLNFNKGRESRPHIKVLIDHYENLINKN